MSVLDPISHALAAVVAATHTGLAALGADPSSGLTWLLCLAAVVVVVRLALLPLTIHGVRQAHASARAQDQIKALARRYRGRTAPADLRRLVEERRQISAEHGVSRLGCLPLLLQVPVWLALYHLVSDLASGTSVGAVDGGMVATMSAASLLGVPLADRGYWGAGVGHLAVVAGLAATAATLSFVTQRYLVAPNAIVADAPEAVLRVQQLMPTLSAVGMLLVGGFVPVALLFYWVCNATWTLGQSAVVWRWFPTPGSPAAARRRVG